MEEGSNFCTTLTKILGCSCPNGPKGQITFTAVLCCIGLTTSLFSFTWVFVFGFVSTIYNLLLLCMERGSVGLLCGAFSSWLVAVLQVVAAATIQDDDLRFCEDSNQGAAICNVALYQAMNGLGGFVWIMNGINVIALPDPQPSTTFLRSAAVSPDEEQTIQDAKREPVTFSEGLGKVGKSEGSFEPDCDV